MRAFWCISTIYHVKQLICLVKVEVPQQKDSTKEEEINEDKTTNEKETLKNEEATEKYKLITEEEINVTKAINEKSKLIVNYCQDPTISCTPEKGLIIYDILNEIYVG